MPDEETCERRLTLTAPDDPGHYRVRFLLYDGPVRDGAPDDFLRLWVTVGAVDEGASRGSSATPAG